MPEIVIPAPRHTAGGMTDADRSLLESERKEGRLCLWAAQGTEEECNESWNRFLLEGTPTWIIYGPETR